jgi:SET domain-containing protein
MKNEHVQTKKSQSGLGLFAKRDFKKGEMIIEYTGEKITEAEANIRGGKYLFELNDNWTIDGKDRKNLARYINHSCKPNCYPELDENEERIFIYAKRNIKSGEELNYNYGKMYFNDIIGKDNCQCLSCIEKRSKIGA